MEFAAGEPSSPSSSDHRRLRRMISNRESARRSRMRKQRRLEDLRSSVGRLRLENHALSDKIATLSGVFAVLHRDNDLLRSESAALRRRLSDIRRTLFLRQLQRISSPPPPPPPPLPAISSSPAATTDAGGIIAGKEQIMDTLS